jgi:hypothetical protein
LCPRVDFLFSRLCPRVDFLLSCLCPRIDFLFSRHTWVGVLKCISELPSPFHQFRLLIALASAWSLTWYQSPGSWVRVLVFAIYSKIAVAPPLVSTCWLSLLPFVSTCWFSLLLSVSTCWLSLLSSHVSGGVEVYKWIA